MVSFIGHSNLSKYPANHSAVCLGVASIGDHEVRLVHLSF
jgi:hypothetical protein